MKGSLDDRIADLSQRVLDAATFEGARDLHYQLDILIARRDGTRPPKPLVRSSDGRGRVVNRKRDRRLRENRRA